MADSRGREVSCFLDVRGQAPKVGRGHLDPRVQLDTKPGHRATRAAVTCRTAASRMLSGRRIRGGGRPGRENRDPRPTETPHHRETAESNAWKRPGRGIQPDRELCGS